MKAMYSQRREGSHNLKDAEVVEYAAVLPDPACVHMCALCTQSLLHAIKFSGPSPLFGE